MTMVSFISRALPLAAALSVGVSSLALAQSAPAAGSARVDAVALTARNAAGQRFRTNARTWREVVLPDGSSVTMGPNTSVSVTSFSFDPATGQRSLQVSVTGGSVRVASGFRAAEQPIVVTTPSGTVTVQNSTAVIRVAGAATVTTLVSGSGVSVAAPRCVQRIARPGFATRIPGPDQPCGQPERLSEEEMAAEMEAVTPPPNVRMTGRARRFSGARPVREERRARDRQTQSESDAPDRLADLPDLRENQPGAAPPLTPPQPPEPPRDQIALNLGAGLGGVAGTEGAVPTETGTAINTTDIPSIQARAEGAVRVRRDPAVGPVPNPYEDQRGGALNSGARDFTLEHWQFGSGNRAEGGGYYLGISPLRSGLGDGPGQEALFDLITRGQVDASSSAVQTVRSIADARVVIGPDDLEVREFVENTSVYDERSSFARVVGRHPIFGSIENFRNLESTYSFAVARFVAYDMLTRAGQRYLAFGGPGSAVRLGQANRNSSQGWVDSNGNILVREGDGTFTFRDPTTVDPLVDDISLELNPVIGQGLVDVSGPHLPGTGDAFTVSTYRISDGLQGFTPGVLLESQPGGATGFNVNDAFRREETFVPGAPRGDTELLVASRAGDGSHNVFLRGDLQVAPDGRSSVSVAVGEIGQRNGKLVLDGALVGSTRTEADRTSLHISGPLGSLGTGYGADDAHFFGGNTRMDGAVDPTNPVELAREKIGYFAVGPADNTNPLTLPPTAAAITERTAGGVSLESYTFTRLAIGVRHQPGTASAFSTRGTRAPTAGYAAGIGESTNARGRTVLTSLDHSGLGPNVKVTASPRANLVQVNLRLRNRDLGTGEARPNPTIAVRMGGATSARTSAYINEKRYAARTAGTGGADAGMIVAPDSLRSGIARADALPRLPGDAPTLRRSIGTYRHVQWGHFFGDLSRTPTLTDRVNLGYLVAGTPTDAARIATGGAARYEGHIAGTVSTRAGLRDHVGSFRNSWNFASRSGQVDASFAGRQYNGTLAAPSLAARNQFGGDLRHTGGLSTMSMRGGFFGPVDTLRRPPETAGSVSIRATAGAPLHSGAGVFVGRRVP